MVPKAGLGHQFLSADKPVDPASLTSVRCGFQVPRFKIIKSVSGAEGGT